MFFLKFFADNLLKFFDAYDKSNFERAIYELQVGTNLKFIDEKSVVVVPCKIYLLYSAHLQILNT